MLLPAPPPAAHGEQRRWRRLRVAEEVGWDASRTVDSSRRLQSSPTARAHTGAWTQTHASHARVRVLLDVGFWRTTRSSTKSPWVADRPKGPKGGGRKMASPTTFERASRRMLQIRSRRPRRCATERFSHYRGGDTLGHLGHALARAGGSGPHARSMCARGRPGASRFDENWRPRTLKPMGPCGPLTVGGARLSTRAWCQFRPLLSPGAVRKSCSAQGGFFRPSDRHPARSSVGGGLQRHQRPCRGHHAYGDVPFGLRLSSWATLTDVRCRCRRLAGRRSPTRMGRHDLGWAARRGGAQVTWWTTPVSDAAPLRALSPWTERAVDVAEASIDARVGANAEIVRAAVSSWVWGCCTPCDADA